MANSVPSMPKLISSTFENNKSTEIDPLLKEKEQLRYSEQGTRANIYRENTMKAEFS